MNNFKLASTKLKKICVDHPTTKCEQLFCKLHNDDYLGTHENSHACLACNLNDSLGMIYMFLKNDKSKNKIEYQFTMFILLSYLTVEKLTIIFKHIGITKDYVETKWRVLIEIRKWANFIKHPKGFLFSHHPEYIFEDEKINTKYSGWKKITYKEFVEKFYNRESEDVYKHTIASLGNKKNILVIMPNPVRIVEELSIVCIEFCEKIKMNEHFKEILKKETVIDDFNINSLTE